ncbi:MAG: type II toxin-antitoxin system VapC family toxin [Candidatus Binatia bacterium]
MKVYFDSSALVAVYVTEAHSERARRKLRRQGAVPWTPLHDVEVSNALRLLRGRGQIDDTELEGLLGHVAEDLQKGRLAPPAIDLGGVFRRAATLSEKHASGTLARTLDILHVAAALEIGSKTVVSGDGRQIALANLAGLRTFDIRGQSGAKASAR